MMSRNQRKRAPLSGSWKLQDAKARFSEVVRPAQSKGPQRVTVHGKDAAVILSAEDYAKLGPTGAGGPQAKPAPDTRTGEDLIKAMRQAGKLGLKLEPARDPWRRPK